MTRPRKSDLSPAASLRDFFFKVFSVKEYVRKARFARNSFM